MKVIMLVVTACNCCSLYHYKSVQKERQDALPPREDRMCLLACGDKVHYCCSEEIQEEVSW